MRGVLIYDREGEERNRWFIERLLSLFKNRDIDLQLLILEETDFSSLDRCNFAIVRTIRPELNRLLESKGIRVFNSYKTSEIANNKWKTYLYCKENHLDTMKTYLSDDLPEEIAYPMVLKSLDGHGGKEVFMIQNNSDLQFQKERFKDRKFILQDCADELGKDLRIYVLGEEIIAGILRTSEKDFRSNFSLGGSVQKVKIPKELHDIIKKITSDLNSDYIGIDFIRNKGKYVLNEIEDVVGARMLYQCTTIDIAERFTDYIVSKL